MLTSTPAGMLLQPCPSHLRRSQTTDNAKEDRQGSKATTKDATHLSKKKNKMKILTLSTICNKIEHFAEKLISFKIVSRKQVNKFKKKKKKKNFAVRLTSFSNCTKKRVNTFKIKI